MSIETARNLTQAEAVHDHTEAIKQQLRSLEQQVKAPHAGWQTSRETGDDGSSKEAKKNYTDLEKEQRRQIDGWFGFDDPAWKKLRDKQDPDYQQNGVIRDEWQTFFGEDLLDRKTWVIKESMKDDMLLFLANLALGKGSDGWIAWVSEQMYDKIIKAKDSYIAMMSERDAAFRSLVEQNKQKKDQSGVISKQLPFPERKKQSLDNLITTGMNPLWLDEQKSNQYRSLPAKKNGRWITLCSQTARFNADRLWVRFQRGDAFAASCNPLVEKRLFRGCLPRGKENEIPHDSWGNIDFSQQDVWGANVMDLYVGRLPPQVSSKWWHRACAVKIDGWWYVLDPYRKVVKDGTMMTTTDPIPLAVYQKTNPILKAFTYQSGDSRLW